DLIKQGATMVTEAADVTSVLQPILGRPIAPQVEEAEAPSPAVEPGNDQRTHIIGLLGPTAVPMDDLIRLSGASPAVVRTVLLDLELAGRLERQGGGLVALP